MIRLEVLGDRQADFRNTEPRNSLEKVWPTTGGAAGIFTQRDPSCCGRKFPGSGKTLMKSETE